MKMHTLPPGQAVALECRCGAALEVTIPYRVSTRDIDEQAEEIAAESHGWGDCGTCPDCQRKIDKDLAEVNAADDRRKLETLNI